MRLVVALGGNALLERGESPLAEVQEKHVLMAVEALAPLARHHDLVITHGNGPQVGLLALESASDPNLPHPYPFDVLGAQTQGMIGYFLLQAFENALPGRQVVSLICQTLVDADDPAFTHPTKFVGPIYKEEEGKRLAHVRGWEIRPDGEVWRRVVASPEPQALVEIATIRTLLADGSIAICAGGGGIPVCRNKDGLLQGVEAVVDKDLTAALLGRDINADALVLLTDVAGIERDFGSESARVIGKTDPQMLREMNFPAGSMGPKVEAVCRFVEATGRQAMIGRLEDAQELVEGKRGTLVEPTGHKSFSLDHLSDHTASEPTKESPMSSQPKVTHRIVVGVDGSPSSIDAVEWAANQARLTGATLEVLMTWEWPNGYGWSPIPSEYNPEHDSEMALDTILKPVRDKHPGISIEAKVIEGHPAPLLVKASDGADLLVVGSRGHGEFAGMLLGSVSEHCVTNAHCPVLVLRDRS